MGAEALGFRSPLLFRRTPRLHHGARSAKACELGADAVIVTRTQTLNLLDHMMVEGTAIAWTLTPAAPPALAPAPPPATQPEPTPPPAPPPAPKAAS